MEIREATLDSALEYLRQQIIKASDGGLKLSFVLQADVNRSALVTLRLNDVPSWDALRYVGQLAGVQFTVDQDAILVRPPVPGPPVSAVKLPDDGEASNFVSPSEVPGPPYLQ